MPDASNSSPGEPSHTPEQDPVKRLDRYVGKTIDGRYVVERVLGEGGMGVVYAGRHRVIDKRVAIKVLRVELAQDQDLTARFLQEARAASAIGNPHIVDISDFGQMPDGATYFVMELLDGKSLGAVLCEAQGPLSVGRLCAIAAQIAQGLAAAHAANIVHRDLKPDNVMLVGRGAERDFVKVLDFGIAKVGGGSVKATRAGSIFGTPHYMSPEQAAGAPVDHRTDIYALGVILYEMASGKVPFDADNFMGILTQHMYKAPVPIRALVPAVDVPPGLEAIILKCLTKKPEGRYASMGELLTELEKVQRGVLPDAVSEMMARSGNFNVPADYYRSAMPAPVPAAPEVPRRGIAVPLIGLAAAIALALAAVGLRATFSAGERLPLLPEQTELPLPSGSVRQPLVASAALSAPQANSSAQVPPSEPAHEVLVSVVPVDSHITSGENDLGTPPVAVLVADEKPSVVLTLTRPGYKTRLVNVDGSQAKWVFTLEPLAVSPPKPSTTKPPVVKPASSWSDDVEDPFNRR